MCISLSLCPIINMSNPKKNFRCIYIYTYKSNLIGNFISCISCCHRDDCTVSLSHTSGGRIAGGLLAKAGTPSSGFCTLIIKLMSNDQKYMRSTVWFIETTNSFYFIVLKIPIKTTPNHRPDLTPRAKPDQANHWWQCRRQSKLEGTTGCNSLSKRRGGAWSQPHGSPWIPMERLPLTIPKTHDSRWIRLDGVGLFTFNCGPVGPEHPVRPQHASTCVTQFQAR